MRTPTSTTRVCRSAARGFTLAEMLAVLAVLSVIAAIIGPRITIGSSKLDMQRDGRAVAAVLREARLTAVSSGARQDVLIDAKKKMITWTKRSVVLDQTEINSVTADEMNSDEGLPQIVYFPDGTSSGGRVTLARDGFAYAIGVDWLTGGVETTFGDTP